MKKILSFSVIAIFFFTSCSKNGSNPTPGSSTKLQITSISVNSGPFGTVVIIDGSGFNATVGNDKVFFNGKAASISAASTTEITAIVPIGAGTGSVTVVVNNGPPANGPIFTYQLSAVVTTLAGSGSVGSVNGKGTSASFNGPYGLTADAAGNLYVADSHNNLIRKVSPNGVVITLAGSGSPDLINGTGTSASFNFPIGVTIDAANNVYVADQCTNGILGGTGSSVIRKITPGGEVITFAGGGAKSTSGFSSQINGQGISASFCYIYGIASDLTGNLYTTDSYSGLYELSYLVREITSVGLVSTIAGNTEPPNFPETPTYIYLPAGIAVDATGIIYVVDYGNSLIRKISASGVITTLAGNYTNGSTDGIGAAATFNRPFGIATDKLGNVYVGDTGNNSIRKITPDGNVTTIAGSGSAGSADGVGILSSFNSPSGLAFDNNGNLYVTDTGNNLIRKITWE